MATCGRRDRVATTLKAPSYSPTRDAMPAGVASTRGANPTVVRWHAFDEDAFSRLRHPLCGSVAGACWVIGVQLTATPRLTEVQRQLRTVRALPRSTSGGR